MVRRGEPFDVVLKAKTATMAKNAHLTVIDSNNHDVRVETRSSWWNGGKVRGFRVHITNNAPVGAYKDIDVEKIICEEELAGKALIEGFYEGKERKK